MSRLMSRLMSENKIDNIHIYWKLKIRDAFVVQLLFGVRPHSLVEHAAVNRGVVGSSPTRGVWESP